MEFAEFLGAKVKQVILVAWKFQTWPKVKIWLWKGEQNKNYQFEFEDD